MKKSFQIIGFIFGVCCLVAIRLFEKTLFHDPLIAFYHGNFLDRAFPDLAFWGYSLNIGFRYVLNSLVSLFLIWIVFKNKTYITFSLLLYVLLFAIAFAAFWMVQDDISSEQYMRLFYIRRFLIQPLLLIILLPAFYFQQLNKKGTS